MAYVMTSANQYKGGKAETTVERYIRDNGFPGAHRARVKHPDIGDILGVPDWTIEVKNIGREILADAMNQLRLAQLESKTPWGLLVKQRRNYPAERWFAVMELGPWARMAALIGEATEEAGERSP
jgi:hypothetical protein